MNDLQLIKTLKKHKIWLHFTHDKISKIKKINQENNIGWYEGAHYKPKGLWYAQSNEWINFLYEDEDFDKEYERLCCWIYKINLKPNIYTSVNKPHMKKILKIKTLGELKKFMELYMFSYKLRNNKFTSYRIDWVKVAKHFGGIEFNPFLYDKLKINTKSKRRLFYWYANIDLKSGCLWNTSIIKNSLELFAYRKNEWDSLWHLKKIHHKKLSQKKNTV